MSYTQSVMKLDNVWEVSQYHTGKYGAPGQERIKKKKPTPEMMKKRNQYNKERLARLRMQQYIKENDYFATFTFKKDCRPPNMEAAVEIAGELRKIINREYKKREAEVFWFRNIEVGTKGAWHIHMVINRIPDTDIILRKAWTYGKVVYQLTYEKGNFRELAAYITKSPLTDSSLKESKYSTSRNMPLPEPEKTVYRHWKTWKIFVEPEDREAEESDYHVRVPKGFYLDKESYHEGTNPFTGYKYRTYTLIRLNRRI